MPASPVGRCRRRTRRHDLTARKRPARSGATPDRTTQQRASRTLAPHRSASVTPAREVPLDGRAPGDEWAHRPRQGLLQGVPAVGAHGTLLWDGCGMGHRTRPFTRPGTRPEAFSHKGFVTGGGDRNRTGVRGFAGPCLNHSATPPGVVNPSFTRLRGRCAGGATWPSSLVRCQVRWSCARCRREARGRLPGRGRGTPPTLRRRPLRRCRARGGAGRHRGPQCGPRPDR